MMNRLYYSERNGHVVKKDIDIDLLRRLFFSTYINFIENGGLDEAFGEGDSPGLVGADIGSYFYKKLYRLDLWPIPQRYKFYSESDLFDVIELLYDLVSYPVYSTLMGRKNFQGYDKKAGQNQFKNDINGYLKNYKGGFELEVNGEIAAVCDTGMEELTNSKVPEYNPDNVEAKIDRAIKKYKSRHSSAADKKDAVRDLADVLEFIRPKLSDVLSKPEEKELFNIANNFGIRHHNEKQKTDYDLEFIDWIFYAYLSTIHLSIKQLNKLQK